MEHVVRSTFTWNTAPGSLMILPEFSQSLDRFPFYWRHLGVGIDTNNSMFTAVVYITGHSSFISASPLHRLMRALSKSSKLHKVFCFCASTLLTRAFLVCVVLIFWSFLFLNWQHTGHNWTTDMST